MVGWFTGRFRVVRQLLNDDSGATIVEYALILTLFSILMMTAFYNIAGNGNTQYSESTTNMSQIMETPPTAYPPP